MVLVLKNEEMEDLVPMAEEVEVVKQAYPNIPMLWPLNPRSAPAS